MCGIVGKVDRQKGVPRQLIEQMCSEVEHRGPDARGIHIDGQVGLGVQRLRVIDVEGGDQPIYNEDRSVAVVLNGEIYNYRELRELLVSRDHRFITDGDTEVIAHLYEEEGSSCVEHLEGMFAVAIWDTKQGMLTLARDRVGKKPLYYAATDRSLAFASELGALMIDPDLSRTINPEALDCYLAYGYIAGPQSIWESVSKLPPAHYLNYQSGQTSMHKYWELQFSPKFDGDFEDAKSELRRKTGAAVQKRMIADVPLGAFLSGGVDSSIVVAEMAAASSRRIRTFSIGFTDSDFNELPRARRIAQIFGTDHEEFIVEPQAAEMIPRLAKQYGEPFADSSALPTFLVAELASQSVTVALNGDGGDESFAGYNRYPLNLAVGHATVIPYAVRQKLAAATRSGRNDAGARSGSATRLVGSLELTAAERFEAQVSIFTRAERSHLLCDPTSTPSGLSDQLVRTSWKDSASDGLDRLLDVDIKTYLPEDLLVKIDRATMAHSLEGRSPFLDHKLMEFAASLPASYKLRRGKKKWILRDAYRGLIPDQILDGRKMGFSVPLDSWLRTNLAGFARETLLDPAALARGITAESEVRRLLDQHQAGRVDRSTQIWTLLMLEHWFLEVGDRAVSPS